MGKIHYIILFNPIQDLVGCIKEGLRMEDSSEAVSKGLRCRALFVFRPKMSSILKRCCQLYTEAVVQSNCIPWQGIRNCGLEPFRYLSSKEQRCSSVSDMVCIFLISCMFRVLQMRRYNRIYEPQN